MNTRDEIKGVTWGPFENGKDTIKFEFRGEVYILHLPVPDYCIGHDKDMDVSMAMRALLDSGTIKKG